MRNKPKSTVMQPTEWLTDTSEMGERIRTFDWSTTPLGPRSSWSPSLRMMVRFLLANRFPLLLWWGSEFIQIYNDPYRPVLGAKHPEPGLGQPVSECWSEIWHILRPLIETPFNGGPAIRMEDIMLEINATVLWKKHISQLPTARYRMKVWKAGLAVYWLPYMKSVRR